MESNPSVVNSPFLCIILCGAFFVTVNMRFINNTLIIKCLSFLKMKTPDSKHG